jgi:hypothetical protein
MLWGVATRRALLRSKLWSVTSPYPDSKFHQLRQLVTTRAARRRYNPRRTTTWLDLNPSDISHGVTPESAPDSRHVPIQDPPIPPVEENELINRRGELNLTSTTLSKEGGSAVLVVSAVSKYLTKTDFTRLLAEEDRAEQGGIIGPFISLQSQRVRV